jgi:Sec7-like guanine-nucleotide exchange factor
LAAIEKQKSFKSKIEKFVLEFNKKPEHGIQYLLTHEIIDSNTDNPSKLIANTLLVVEGLNKEMIGQYLGSHHEKNREVLKFYCEFLDFRGLELDKAMRNLLSMFKLPPEAQQIGRIIEVFSEVYHRDNPQMFPNADAPFILSYSLLMLNTDAHSEKIPKNKKMSKQVFVENNMRICKDVPKEFLEHMYDNIVKRKFETAVDCISKKSSLTFRHRDRLQ